MRSLISQRISVSVLFLWFAGISFTSNRSNSSEASCSTNNSGTSGTSGTSSLSLSSKNRSENLHNHRKHDNCGSHCLGAIPRNPQYSQYQKPTTPKSPTDPLQQQQEQYHTPNKHLYTSKRNTNYYTPKSASYSIFSSDMQNRLPPIKEFRSPTKTSIASPSRVASAPRLR